MRLSVIIGIFLSITNIVWADEPLNIKTAGQILDQIEAELSAGRATAQNLSDNLKTINSLQSQINQSKAQTTEKLENAQKKLEALGEAPTGETSESAEIATKRKEFNADVDTLKTEIAQIDLLNAKIEEISALTLKIRNKSLLSRILERQTSVLQFQDFGKSLARFGAFIINLIKSPNEWYKGLNKSARQKLTDNLGAALGIIFFIAAFAFWLSHTLRKRYGYQDCAVGPSYTQKLRSAVAMAFSLGIVPSAVIGAFLFWLNSASLLEGGNLKLLLYDAAIFLLAFCIIRAAVRVVLVPRCGNWRIVNLNDTQAQNISRALIFSAALILSFECLLYFARQTSTEPESIYALQILGIAAKIFGLFITTHALFREPTTDISDVAPENISLETKVNLTVSGFIFILIIATLAGYVPLAEFLLNRVILSILAIGAFWLLDKFIRFAVHRLLLFKFWREKLRIGARFLVKTEFWFGLLLAPFIWLAALITVLSLWGFSTDIMLHDIKNFLLGFNIGDMRVSIVSLALGIVVFFGALFVAKSLKQSLLHGNLSKIEMQEDTRASLAAGISLIGFIVALVVAFAVMGGSLKSIAIVAGALSFGVGLGMQNIVSNFVSGIIILFERPIKIGDWVVINGQEGIVKTISMRATLLEAFNKSEIIIPNSAILSSSLVNMTYTNRAGQVAVKINVKYGANATDVRQTLVEIAKETPGVLATPEPSAAFSNMGDTTMEFTLQCYVANVFDRQAVMNYIYEKILETFPLKGFEIPNVPTPNN